MGFNLLKKRAKKIKTIGFFSENDLKCFGLKPVRHVGLQLQAVLFSIQVSSGFTLFRTAK